MTITCDYCGRDAVLTPTREIYNGRDFGWAWRCLPCGAWVGCHKGTKKPLGRLANSELREWKKNAHAAFDPLWQEVGMSRPGAYSWLASRLGIESSQCHIGMFNVETCKQVVTLCNQVMIELEPISAAGGR